MSIFQDMTQAMINNAVANGHIGIDAPVWGQYEGYTRAALLAMKRRFIGTPISAVVDSILRGE